MSSTTPSMTRQHFEMMAKIIRGLNEDCCGNITISKESLVLLVANELAKTNSNFDPKRFTDACWEKL